MNPVGFLLCVSEVKAFRVFLEVFVNNTNLTFRTCLYEIKVSYKRFSKK